MRGLKYAQDHQIYYFFKITMTSSQFSLLDKEPYTFYKNRLHNTK